MLGVKNCVTGVIFIICKYSLLISLFKKLKMKINKIINGEIKLEVKRKKMWKSAISYVLSSSSGNYSVQNMNNLFNFFLAEMDDRTPEQNIKFLDNLILHVGKTVYKNFRDYVFSKLPNSPHLQLINRVV